MYVWKGRSSLCLGNSLFTSVTWTAETTEVDNWMSLVADLNAVGIPFVRMVSYFKSAEQMLCCE